MLISLQTIIDEEGNLQTITDGATIEYSCKAMACVTSEDPNACVVGKFYEHGCCVGSSCDEEEKCGEWCPTHFPCWPKREDCTSVSCYECEKGPDGEELYRLKEMKTSVDCLATGTKKNVDGEEYKWAIACGPVEQGGSTELNMAEGEYRCKAFRQGAGIEINSSPGMPCQWLQINECGCAPTDVFSFGVEPPDPEVGWTPCLTEDDCRFLCADAGQEKVKNLCHAFDGIEWWEGDNFMNSSGFLGDVNYDVEINLF